MKDSCNDLQFHMDTYDRCTNLGKKKNLADISAIYGRGRELFRPPTYIVKFPAVSHPCKNRPSGKTFLRTDEAEKLSISHPVSPTVLSFIVILTPLATYRDYELTVTSLPSVLSWKHNFTVQLQIFRTFANFQNCSEITHFS